MQHFYTIFPFIIMMEKNGTNFASHMNMLRSDCILYLIDDSAKSKRNLFHNQSVSSYDRPKVWTVITITHECLIDYAFGHKTKRHFWNQSSVKNSTISVVVRYIVFDCLQFYQFWFIWVNRKIKLIGSTNSPFTVWIERITQATPCGTYVKRQQKKWHGHYGFWFYVLDEH